MRRIRPYYQAWDGREFYDQDEASAYQSRLIHSNRWRDRIVSGAILAVLCAVVPLFNRWANGSLDWLLGGYVDGEFSGPISAAVFGLIAGVVICATLDLILSDSVQWQPTGKYRRGRGGDEGG